MSWCFQKGINGYTITHTTFNTIMASCSSGVCYWQVLERLSSCEWPITHRNMTGLSYNLLYFCWRSWYICSPASSGAPRTLDCACVTRASSGMASTASTFCSKASRRSLNPGRREESGCLQYEIDINHGLTTGSPVRLWSDGIESRQAWVCAHQTVVGIHAQITGIAS